MNCKLRELSGAESKQIIFDILSTFAEYCDKRGLRYFLSYGTLLGAIRHQGFIPWDDDIDVTMPRPDYIKLHELVKKEPISDKYVLKSSFNGTSVYPFAKLCDKRTRVESRENNEEEMLWIDIFPLDGVPAGESGKKYLQKAYRLRYRLMLSITKLGAGKTKCKAIAKIPFVLWARIIGKANWLRKIEKHAQQLSFDEAENIGEVVFSLGAKEQMPKDIYIKRTTATFEGKEFWIPGCWDRYLTQMYGDYMTPPPENKRYNHSIVAYKIEQ